MTGRGMLWETGDPNHRRNRIMSETKHFTAKGRGSQLDPPSRFGGPLHVLDLEQVEHDEDYLDSLRNRHTQHIPDRSKSIITENDSPDVGFRFSLNPYRGCQHGCA